MQLSGLSVLGDRSVKIAGGAGPVIHLDAYAVLGSVTVKHGKDRKDRKGVRGGAGSGEVVRSGPGEIAHPGSAGPGRIRRAFGAIALAGVLAAGAVGFAAAGEDRRVVFGSSTVGAEAGDDVEVSMLFGSMRVVVPDGVQVRTGGTVIFGSVDCEQACRGERTGGAVDVRAIGGFGSVEILTQSEADREADRGDEDD